MEGARKISAAIIGIVMIILLVLLARWTGEKIRERFFTPKPIIIDQKIPPTIPEVPVEKPDSATYSAIPKTGPAETGLILLGFLFISGFVLLTTP